ncbi:DUF3043 domain-containing protein [Arcanobacterium haemolyticum]|nr:DUF3043 domain-containing protein [Arcanobacterium haemolyticum]
MGRLDRDGVRVFGRKKESEELTASEPVVTQAPKGHTPGKGTPTPKRKDVEAARRRPIIADHSKMSRAEKKAYNAERRAKADELWQKQQLAMKTGDERNMPPMHAGPVRRFARDYLDARFNLGVVFMPLALLLLVSMFIQSANIVSPRVFFYAVIAVYIFFVIMIFDSWWGVRNAKILIEHKFGEGKVPRQFTWQMISRTLYLPRWRMPRPMTKFGEFPEGGTPTDLKEARKARRAKKK